MKKFNNIPNELVDKNNIGDRQFWISRSVAVVATILIEKDSELFVLIGKRGKGTPDFQGYYCMPCGYLDWNETATEAVYREVYEETGLDIEKFLKDVYGYGEYGNDRVIGKNAELSQPWFVEHRPKNNRQNITLRFGIIIQSDYLPELTNEHCEPDEVDEVLWLNIKDLDKYEYAFGHENIIREFITRD